MHQTTFRAVLDAMGSAGPACIRRAQNLTVPAPLDRATAAVLLTLIDNETPLWLDPAASAARDWLAFHCGAAIVVRLPSAATFALALSLPNLEIPGFRAGTHETLREVRATLILQVPALGTGARYRLSGPGVARARAARGGRSARRDFARILAGRTTRSIRAGSTSCCAPIPR